MRFLRRSLGVRVGRGGLVGRVNGGDKGVTSGRVGVPPWGCSTFGRLYSPKGEHLGRARALVTVRCVIGDDRRAFFHDSSRRVRGVRPLAELFLRRSNTPTGAACGARLDREGPARRVNSSDKGVVSAGSVFPWGVFDLWVHIRPLRSNTPAGCALSRDFWRGLVAIRGRVSRGQRGVRR